MGADGSGLSCPGSSVVARKGNRNSVVLGLGRVGGSHRLSDCPYVHKATLVLMLMQHRADGHGAR